MWRAWRYLLTAAAVLSSGDGGAATPAPADLRARLPDGRILFLTCAGSGSPTVLLDAGWAADHNSWRAVMPGIAARTRVCAYDRAGSGRSDPGPLPRDGKAIARDLARGLRAAGIAGPYVVVGHSIGALFARHFAERRPRAIAGIVLVDATVPYQQRRFEAVYGPGAGSLEPIIARARRCLAAAEALRPGQALAADCARPAPAAARWRNLLSELETLFGTTSAQLAAGPASYGRLPLITLTAANTYSGGTARLWFDLHKEVARRSSRGEARLVAGSGHMIARDQPAAVIQAVNDVVAMARRR